MKKLLNYFMLVTLLGVIGCSSSKDDPIYNPASISKIAVDGVTRANISEEAHVYEFEIPADMDLKALAIDVTIIDGYPVNFKNDPEKERNMTEALVIKLKGDNGDEVEWTIKVKQLDKVGEQGSITSIKIDGEVFPNLNLDEKVLEYQIDMKKPADITKLKLDITLSEGAEFDGYTNEPTKEQDLTEPLIVKVKGTDGSLVEWKITVKAEKLLPEIELDGKMFTIDDIVVEKVDNSDGLTYRAYTINKDFVGEKGLIFHTLEFDRAKAKDYTLGAIMPNGTDKYKLGDHDDVLTIFGANANAIAAMPGDTHTVTEGAADFMVPYGAITINGVTAKTASQKAWNLAYGADKDGVPFVDNVEWVGTVTAKDGTSKPISQLNGGRGASQLVMFNKYKAGTATGTNTAGAEAYFLPKETKDWYKQVDPSKAVVEPNQPFMNTGGALEFTEKDLILSGHGDGAGDAADFVRKIFKDKEATVSVKLRGIDDAGAATGKEYAAMTTIGGQYVLKDGVVAPSSVVVAGNHARSAIGHSKDGGKIFMVVIDGGDKSAGASPKNIGEILKFLGAHDGINAQGGSSSALVVEGKLKNAQASNKKIPNMIGIVKK